MNETDDFNHGKVRVPEEDDIFVSLLILIINSVLGSIGNSIVVLVYGHKNFNNSSDIFIFILACLDLSVSMIYMPISMHQMVSGSLSRAICLVDKGGAFAYVTISFAMFFCIATDRLVAVMKPYDYKLIMTPFRAKVLSSVSIVCGLFASTPISISCFTETTSDDQTHLNIFMRCYSAVVILLTIFLTGKLLNK